MCNSHIVESKINLDGKIFSLTKAKVTEGDGWIFTIDQPDIAQESIFMPKEMVDHTRMKALYLLTKQPCGEFKK